MEIRPRSDWLPQGAEPPRPAFGAVRYAVVHHTVAGDGADPIAALREIHALHTRANGWDDIGYNLLVDGDGGAWEGRAGGIERAVVGAHTAGHNSTSTGIAVLGDRTETVTDAALDMLTALLEYKLALHGLVPGPDTVKPHCELANTECPGAALLQAVRRRSFHSG